MAFCYQLEKGFCGGAIRSAVNCGFCHYILHGIFVASFVFTNTSYPSFYYVDYIFGGSGGTLIVVALSGMMIASLQNYQFIRIIWAVLVVLNVLLVVVSCFYYTIVRWDDVIVTAFTRLTTKHLLRDFPDTLWFALAVICCIVSPFLLIYLVYILSYMCNKWKLYLFNEANESGYGGLFSGVNVISGITVPKTPQSSAYPSQKY